MGRKRKLVAGSWSLARETVYCKGKTLRASTKLYLAQEVQLTWRKDPHPCRLASDLPLHVGHTLYASQHQIIPGEGSKSTNCSSLCILYYI